MVVGQTYKTQTTGCLVSEDSLAFVDAILVEGECSTGCKIEKSNLSDESFWTISLAQR